MNNRIVKLAVALTSGVAMAFAAAQVYAQAAQPTLEGVWRVVRHGVNCHTGQQLNSFPALMAFGRDGSYTGNGVPPGSTPANGIAEYGSWKREPGTQNYSFKFVSYGYTDSGAFDGSAEITARLELAPGGANFSYEAVIRFFDADGNPVFAGCGAAAGTRFE